MNMVADPQDQASDANALLEVVVDALKDLQLATTIGVLGSTAHRKALEKSEIAIAAVNEHRARQTVGR